MQVQVKNIKTFTGMEGPGFSGTLYVNGVSRGNIYDDATGGPLAFDDYKAAKEICEYMKQFSDDEFEHEAVLIYLIINRELEAKRLRPKFNNSLVWLGEDGLLHLTNKIKNDVEATKARWMADPSTKAKLKVKRYITDVNEFLTMFFVEQKMTHPALDGATKAVTVVAAVKAPVQEIATRPLATTAKEVLNTGSKLDRCRALYNPALARKDMIAIFVAQCDCTPAGAGTYYQKLKA